MYFQIFQYKRQAESNASGSLAKQMRRACCVMFAALFLGCTTPPQTPSSPPQSQPPPPPPPPQQTQPREQQTETTQGGSAESQTPPQAPPPEQSEPQPPAATADTQATPPPAKSTESADVEIRDIPVDEDGNPIEPPKRETAAAPTSAGQTSPASMSGGGGNTVPPGGSNRAGSQANTGSAQTGGPPSTETINVAPITAQERGAALEANLEDKLAEFDELMRKARQEAAAQRTAQGGGGASAGGAGARPLPPLTSGAGGQADRSSGLGSTPDITGTTQPGEYRGAVGPTPTDIPDARDDDIVARQLREAASRESDPVLQEKLWEEYRKYKKGIGH